MITELLSCILFNTLIMERGKFAVRYWCSVIPRLSQRLAQCVGLLPQLPASLFLAIYSMEVNAHLHLILSSVPLTWCRLLIPAPQCGETVIKQTFLEALPASGPWGPVGMNGLSTPHPFRCVN